MTRKHDRAPPSPPQHLHLQGQRHISLFNSVSFHLLSRNQLSGWIPNSITQIYRLADLDLALNLISDKIPAALGKMPALSTLNFDNNRLTGQIPASLLGCSGLSILNLRRNSLEGCIPEFNFLQYLTFNSMPDLLGSSGDSGTDLDVRVG